MSNTKQQHYWLIAGTVVFVMDGEEHPVSIPMNGVLRQDDIQLNVKSISQAQMALQALLAPKMQGAGAYTIVDVVVGNLMYLGFMTGEQFEAGVSLPNQEQVTPAAEATKPKLSVVHNDDINQGN
jgi:hypothetical protein